jgi:F-type H+-transporting ATPase subunit epsilon
MSAQLQFDLVSPEKTVLSKSVVFVTIPAEEGYLGVLEGHTPYIVSIVPGVVEVYENSQTEVTDRFFVAGGFAEINGTSCTVLAEEALPVAELNRAEVQEQANNLTEDLALAEEDAQRTALEAKLEILRAKLDAAK